MSGSGVQFTVCFTKFSYDLITLNNKLFFAMVAITKKLSVYELSIGMYICRLDRPWASTDYPLEGFYITSKDEIYKLFELCEHVYIDQQLSHENIPLKPKNRRKSKNNTRSTTAKRTTRVKTDYPLRIKDQKSYSIYRPFKKEVSNAKKRHRDLTKSINSFFNKITEQKVPQIEPIKKVVAQTVDSIVANPDAMMWLVRTKKSDDYGYNFVLKQTIWALAIARQIGMNKSDMQHLALASILSAIGKNKIPLKIVQKEPHFNAKEFNQFKQHVDYSVNMLQQMKNIPPQVIMIVAGHCEFINGTGYPKGLSGRQIPVSSQILGLSSFYESLSCPRDIHSATSPNEAIDIVFEQRDKKFHKELVEHFIQAIGIYPSGTLVQLNNGEVAVIVDHSEDARLTPKVMILRNKQNLKPKKQKVIDLLKYQDKFAIQQSLPVGSYGIVNEEITDAVLNIHNKWSFKNLIGM